MIFKMMLMKLGNHAYDFFKSRPAFQNESADNKTNRPRDFDYNDLSGLRFSRISSPSWRPSI